MITSKTKRVLCAGDIIRVNTENGNTTINSGNIQKKYELVLDSEICEGPYLYQKLYRIKALRDFGDVKKGDLGGYVHGNEDFRGEPEFDYSANLSHQGDCWIYDDAKVYDGAIVWGNSKVRGNSLLKGNGIYLLDNAQVYDRAVIMTDDKAVGAGIYISGNAKVFEDAIIYNTNTSTTTIITDNAKVHGNANINGNINISGNADLANNIIANNKETHSFNTIKIN